MPYMSCRNLHRTGNSIRDGRPSGATSLSGVTRASPAVCPVRGRGPDAGRVKSWNARYLGGSQPQIRSPRGCVCGAVKLPPIRLHVVRAFLCLPAPRCLTISRASPQAVTETRSLSERHNSYRHSTLGMDVQGRGSLRML